MGLQFQRGLSDGDWELEERVTKKSCGAGRRSVYTVLIQAAKMEIPGTRPGQMASSPARPTLVRIARLATHSRAAAVRIITRPQTNGR